MGKWDQLHHEVIEQELAQLPRREIGFERSLLSLLGWVARMGDLPDFPHEVAWALEESAITALSQDIASHGIVLATCCMLAGQLYPQRHFAGWQTGEPHPSKLETAILAWLQATAQMGLPEGESHQSYTDAILALSHLIDLAHADEVAEMAAVALDKLAYQLALQSFLGVWGGSQDQAHADWALCARLNPLSGLLRLWWGQGAFNSECAAVVAVACCESYQLPDIIAAVGLDRQQEAWQRRQDLRPESGIQIRVNRAAYRTGDYLLASAPGDWSTGTPALLWQVTLGPDAIIVGNRPTSSSDHPAWQASYWRGSATPVRVGQWQDVLIAGYRPERVAGALNFSHAYFPSAVFDEAYFAQGWAMARKGNGYVALTATGGVDLVTGGHTAQREVRAAAQSIWLVQMGRAARDGGFAQFVAKVLAQPLTLAREHLRYTTLRGQVIEFDLNVPLNEALLVDGTAQTLDNFPHLESLYGGASALPASHIEIRYLEHRMRLDLGTPEMRRAI